MGSSHEKTLAKVVARPTSASVTWREVENLLRALGAEMSEGAGSRVRIALNGRKSVIHRPHPEKELNKGAVESLRDFLTEAGIIE